ncbi:MAG: hypothetical protein AAFV49_23350, partial [Pseudomonadota bacterium]
MLGHREIGHGALAVRALLPAVALKRLRHRVESLIADFSDSSGGSSSVASVCGGPLVIRLGAARRSMRRHGSLVLPDGNVDESILLTDIRGIEDALDFKGAGDGAGISAYQLDVMRLGLSPAILADAVAVARAARRAVLDIMCAACPGRGRTSCPRPRTSNDATKSTDGQVFVQGM